MTMQDTKFKPVTRTIGGHTVEVTPFAARPALIYKFKLLQLLGGPLVDLIRGPISGLLKVSGGKPTGLGNLDLNLDGLTSHIFDTLDPDRSTQLIFDMCAGTRFDNQEMTETFINGQFSGDLSVLYRVFFFILEVNYKDFLGLLGTIGRVVPTTEVKK